MSSYRRAQIPVYVGSQRCLWETEVVDIDLPLLISKQAMKSTGMILNFEKDRATLNGDEIALDTTSSGHYALCLTRQRNQLSMLLAETSVTKPQHTFINFDMSRKSTEEKRKAAVKLHRQFGHPTHEKLSHLLKLSGSEDNEFLDVLQKMADLCETCMKYKKKNPRPMVGLSLSREFNATITMDLKQIQGKLIL